MVKLAINGFGRIGRVALRVALQLYSDQVEVVAVNTSGSMGVEGWAHLFEYDTVYRKFEGQVGYSPSAESAAEDEIGRLLVDRYQIPLLAQREPEKIPWSKYQPEVVLEATGVFRDQESVGQHLTAGAKKVILTAPPQGDDIPIYIIGVNEKEYQGEALISIGSCTTNCVAPIAKIILDHFEIEEAMMTTIHAYTSNQELVDGSHRDLRRARAAAQNIVPTSTGAGRAVIAVLPGLKGRFAATAVRVPVICGSYSDLTFKLTRKTTVEEVNGVLKKAAEGELKKILLYSQEPLVSVDILGTTYSAVIDAQMTKVVSDDLIQIAAWYDNEWAYCCRLIEMAIKVAGENG